MALDGKILARARNTLEERRRQKEERLGLRTQDVYAKSPRINEIDTKLRATMAELVGVALNSDAKTQVEDIRLKNLELQKERQAEIKLAGFPKNYLDDEYMCLKCHDTGYIDTKMCKCFMALHFALRQPLYIVGGIY